MKFNHVTIKVLCLEFAASPIVPGDLTGSLMLTQIVIAPPDCDGIDKILQMCERQRARV